MGPERFRGVRRTHVVLPSLDQPDKSPDGSRGISQGPEGPRNRSVCTLEVSRDHPRRGGPHEEIQSVLFDERDAKKVFKIGMTLGVEQEAMLIRVLMEHWDIFSWEPKDRSEDDSTLTVNHAYVDPHYKSVLQGKPFVRRKGGYWGQE
ncbi:hypothetical protein LIER_09672 [Lithospermum erythrorhizon]|uniref:Uncharacterized protein n=1 Tax=Lithospermum erythrorhizon TaxID=34254 RepID=A0AAV3PHU1_LITER